MYISSELEHGILSDKNADFHFITATKSKWNFRSVRLCSYLKMKINVLAM